jgi:hypothetical protein
MSKGIRLALRTVLQAYLVLWLVGWLVFYVFITNHKKKPLRY